VRRPGDRAGAAPDVREGDAEGHHAAGLLRRPGCGPAELRRHHVHQGGELAGQRPVRTGVGGTLLDADGLTGAYHGETTWNEPEYEAATGGGFSRVYGTPLFQKQLGLPSRGVPDVAYNAGIGTGVLTVWSTSGFGPNLLFIFGGTSAGSPQWAGLTALAAQLRHARVGYLNPQVYALSLARPVYTALFHDITTGGNTFHGETGGDPTIEGFPAARGWDPATGLGTPKANRLVPVLGGQLP
jgi:subtilase family serine protease